MGWPTRAREGAGVSSRTSPSRSLWSGVPALRRWRLPLNWRRLSTRACSNSPSAPTPRETPISDFIDEFLEDQVASIKSIGDTITKLKRVGDGLGLFLFDKEMAA